MTTTEISSDDKLWEQTSMHRHIDEFAYRITAPLSRPARGSSSSLTFAIHGPWGSGKTSFIQMVLDRAGRYLEESQKKNLLVCWYRASAFEGLGDGARATMAMQVLSSDHEFSPAGAERTFQFFGQYLSGPEAEIVPGHFVLWTRIPQEDNRIVHMCFIA